MEDLDLMFRLVVAALLGMSVGLERQLHNQVVGMRTHALVAVGACLFTIGGAYGFTDFDRGSFDPARVAAQVAAGIGFIGAGAILREGSSVRGITTASTLWLAGALGVAAGAGLYLTAIAGAVVALLVLVGLRMLRPVIGRVGTVTTVLEVEYERGHGTIGPLLRSLEQRKVRVEQVQVEDDVVAPNTRTVFVTVEVRGLPEMEVVADELRERPEVRAVLLRRYGGLSE